MKLIVGLGNPGLCYEHTRHNLGAKALKIFAKEHKAKFILERSLKSRITKVTFGDRKCLLAIPTTFMNLSGEAVKLLLKSKRISAADLLVVHDDMDLEFGKVRFKKQGGAGGHKGIASVINTLETQGFNRLKLGVGKSPTKKETKEYVLCGFSKTEKKVLSSLLDEVAKACQVWTRFGIDKAMNEFN